MLAPHMSGPKPQQAAQQMLLVVVVFAECSCSIGPATTRAEAEEDIINKNSFLFLSNKHSSFFVQNLNWTITQSPKCVPTCNYPPICVVVCMY
jgi:hypothetical protein